VHEKCNIPDIIEKFSERQNEPNERTKQSFLVSFDEIKKNDWDLSINRYKEIIYTEIEYSSPSKLIEEIKKLDSQRTELIMELEKIK